MKERQQFADSAPPARSRGRGRSANGGLRGASRSPARKGGDTSGCDHSAKRTTKKRRNQTQSHNSTPFRPLEQNYTQRSGGDERSALYMEEPMMRVGADILETLSKDERDVCLLMVDVLSRQSHVTALRIIGSLHQRLDVKRYLDLYGGTYAHSVTPQNVKDLDGRRELMEHLMAAQQALAEARRPDAEARESARMNFLSSNNPASRSGGTKLNQTGTKGARKAPAPPRSPAKKEAPRSNLPPNLRHMSYSAADSNFSSENSPGSYSNSSPMSNHPPPPVAVPAAATAAAAALWSNHPAAAAQQPPAGAAAAAPAHPAATGAAPAPAALPPKAPETQPHVGGAYTAPEMPPPATNNVTKYSTLGADADEMPEEDWLHDSPSLDKSPEVVPSSSRGEEHGDGPADAHIDQRPTWEAPPAQEDKDDGVVDREEDEEREARSASQTDEDYFKKPGDEDDDEEQIEDIADEEEEIVDASDNEDAEGDDKPKADSAFPWDDI